MQREPQAGDCQPHTHKGGGGPTKVTNQEGNPAGGVSPKSGPRSQPNKKMPEARITRGTGVNKEKAHPRQQASNTKQIPRQKRLANQHSREKMQAKRDLGARTKAPKQSQQPGKPYPERKSKTEHLNHRKLWEMAATLIHPRLKTEWGNSPCPKTHS